MKKVLRFIGVLLLIIMAGVIILGLIAPKDIQVERALVINAPKHVVAKQMFSFSNFENWNPWLAYDPNTKSTIEGEDGTQGSRYSWTSDEIGSGEMVMDEVSDEQIHYSMKFFNPWGDSDADGYWKLQDLGNGQTKAVWTFNTHMGFPFNGLMMAMGMGKSLEKDFDKGLDNLKNYAEMHANDAPDYKIESIQYPGHTYAAIRKTISVDHATMMQFFDESYQALGQAAGPRISGPASALTYNWDEANKQADIAVAFPVSGEEAVKGATMIRVDPSPAYRLTYMGGYSGLYAAHDQIGKHVAAQGKTPTLALEEYITSPGEERDSTKWVTHVIYLVN